MWKFKDIEFLEKRDRDMFMEGYNCCLSDMQKNRKGRGKEYEVIIPFRK